MLVTPSRSVRTVKPATAVANHRKLRRRENAGRSNQITSHQAIHSGMATSGSLLARYFYCQQSIACGCYTNDKQTPR